MTASRFHFVTRVLLHLGGFGGLSAAAWGIDWRAGMAVGAVSCFVFAWLLEPGTDPRGSVR